jgi:AcrR family transcriptional regulator
MKKEKPLAPAAPAASPAVSPVNPPGSEAKPRGRPRAFDRDKAVEQAIGLFWKRGYEATSVADLKKALGIESPSLYAAFGSKDGLFRECVDRYSARYLADIGRALMASETARAGVELLLLRFAAHYAGAGHPKGCLVVSAATNCSLAAAAIENDLKHRRGEGVDLVLKRIRQGIEAGEFRSKPDAGELARYYSAVLLGMAMRARDGGSLKELETTARMALLAWPR